MAAPRFKLGSASETAAGNVAALGEVSCCCEVVESSGGVTAPRLGTCSRVVPGSACSLLVPTRQVQQMEANSRLAIPHDVALLCVYVWLAVRKLGPLKQD
jgi:hypothetical protein